MVDKNGIPLSAIFKPGNIHDSQIVDETLMNYNKIKHKKIIRIGADKGYVGKNIKLIANKYNMIIDTPHKKYKNKELLKNNNIERNCLKGRYVVERTFSWLDKFRRLIVRYDNKIITVFSGKIPTCISAAREVLKTVQNRMLK